VIVAGMGLLGAFGLPLTSDQQTAILVFSTAMNPVVTLLVNRWVASHTVPKCQDERMVGDDA
jgi:hypothetical protein